MSCPLPRRYQLDHLTWPELALVAAQHAVEKAGHSAELTRASELLDEVRDLVAEHVEEDR